VNSQLRSIVVYDFGSQYTRLIARRLRELGVYSVIVGPHVPARDLAEHEPGVPRRDRVVRRIRLVPFDAILRVRALG